MLKQREILNDSKEKLYQCIFSQYVGGGGSYGISNTRGHSFSPSVRISDTKPKTLDLLNISEEWYTGLENAKSFVDKGKRKIETEPLEKLIDKFLKDASRGGADMINIIDIGCGDAEKSIFVYDYISKSTLSSVALHVLDYSDDMLNIARQNLYLNNIEPTTVKKLDIRKEIFNPNKNTTTRNYEVGANLVLFLGETIGNFSDTHPILSNLLNSASVHSEFSWHAFNDKVLLDFDIKKNKDSYEDPKFMRMFLQKVGFNNSELKYCVKEDNEGIKAYLEYIGSTDKTITSHRRPSIIIKSKDNFLVGLSRKFDRNHFKPENQKVFFKNNYYQDIKYKDRVYCMFSGIPTFGK
jgi:hypothetical protein